MPSSTSDRNAVDPQLARRNVRSALLHVALGASFLLAFFLMQAYR